MIYYQCDCGRKTGRDQVQCCEHVSDLLAKYQCTGCHRLYYVTAQGRRFISQYPRLVYALREMFEDNNIQAKPECEWLWPDCVVRLEKHAAKFSDHELVTLVAGEREAMVALLDAHDAQELDEFFDRVFDGGLTQDFVQS